MKDAPVLTNNVLEVGVLAHDADGAALSRDLDLRIEEGRKPRSREEIEADLARSVKATTARLRDLAARLDAGRLEWVHAAPAHRGLLLDLEVAVRESEAERRAFGMGGSDGHE